MIKHTGVGHAADLVIRFVATLVFGFACHACATPSPNPTKTTSAAKSSTTTELPLAGKSTYDASVVATTITPRLPEIEQCYRFIPAVETEFAQHVVAELHVSSTGEVMDSFLYFETSNQPAFRACIREKLNQLKFPPNDLTEPSSIYFPLVFLSHPTRQVRRQCFIEHAMVTENPGLRIPTSLTTTSIDGEGPPWRNNAVGSLDKEIIRRVIRSRIGEVASCYDRGLTGRPTMQGRVAIQFTIMGDGSVQTVRLHNTTMENAFVEDCVLRSACDLRFPATNGGGFVRVSYPYNFTTNLAD